MTTHFHAYSAHHFRRCSSPTAMLLLNAPGGARTHEQPPVAIPLTIFMTTYKPSNQRSKMDGCQPDSCPCRNSLNMGQISLNAFLRTCQKPLVGSMNLIKIKNLEGVLSPSPLHVKGGLPPRPHFVQLVGGAHQKLAKFLSFSHSCPKPSEAF